MTNQQKIEAIREILREYCDPKPQWDGMNTYELAEKILDNLDNIEKNEEENKKPRPKEPTGDEDKIDLINEGK